MIPHGLEHVRLHDGHPKAMVRSAASWRLPNMCHARQTRSNKWIYHSYRTRRPRKCHKEEVSKKGELFWDMDGSANPLMDRPAVEALNLPHSLSLSLYLLLSLKTQTRQSLGDGLYSLIGFCSNPQRRRFCAGHADLLNNHGRPKSRNETRQKPQEDCWSIMRLSI